MSHPCWDRHYRVIGHSWHTDNSTADLCFFALNTVQNMRHLINVGPTLRIWHLSRYLLSKRGYDQVRTPAKLALLSTTHSNMRSNALNTRKTGHYDEKTANFLSVTYSPRQCIFIFYSQRFFYNSIIDLE